jgi:hypothetical protein
VFDYIQLYDGNMNPLTILDFGTPLTRPHLLSGWSYDETWAGGTTMVWAQGTQRKAAVEMEIPASAQFMEIRCYSLPADNSLTLKINDAQDLSLNVSQTLRSYFIRLGKPFGGGVPTPEPQTGRPFALFLNSSEAARDLDGFASYGSYLRSSHALASDPKPTILTVGCGYDDRKIRYPGTFVDRENGALYRRQWEKALDGRPDLVLINTWNEWAEGTIIEPTVEFGYKYLELTLTYALMLHDKMSASRKPSEMDLTVAKYQVNQRGDSEICFRAAKGGTVVFKGLPLSSMASLEAFREGQSFAAALVDRVNGSIAVSVPDNGGDFSFSFSSMMLQVSRSEQGIVIAWPSKFSDAFLEQCGDIEQLNWQAVPLLPVVIGQWHQIEVPVTGATIFYRLKRP